MVTNEGRSWPVFASSTGKYLWCFFITITRISLGSLRKSWAKDPMMAVGYSTRLVTSGRSSCRIPSGMTPPAAAASAWDWAQIAPRLSSMSTIRLLPSIWPK